jgi:hypothetical protein
MVFPNPVADRATLYLGAETEQVQVALYTIYGQLVREETAVPQGNEVELDFGTLPSGVYLVSFWGDGIKGTYKVIKK